MIDWIYPITYNMKNRLNQVPPDLPQGATGHEAVELEPALVIRFTLEHTRAGNLKQDFLSRSGTIGDFGQNLSTDEDIPLFQGNGPGILRG